MGKDSFWSSLARSLGISKQGAGPRERQIQQYLADLRDSNDDRRRSAAWSLGKMKPPPKEAIAALTDAANKDTSPFVRQSAQWALRVIKGI